VVNVARTASVRQGRPADDFQAHSVPLRWRIAKADPIPVQVQLGTASTVVADSSSEVSDYYRNRAAAFRLRHKLPTDDGPADNRLF